MLLGKLEPLNTDIPTLLTWDTGGAEGGLSGFDPSLLAPAPMPVAHALARSSYTWIVASCILPTSCTA